ncbi:MAG: protein-export chaperone SecB [Chromatiaceae bacterium]|nr:protein-export chaperone SecB [Chromatiaceae bacterium]
MSDEQQPQRQFMVQRIYTKDISFEAPNTPQIFQENWSPEINVGLGSEVHKLENASVELVMSVNVEAKHQGKTVFMVEVKQAGLFHVQGFNDDEADALMGIAAPNVLFPYAREVISDLVTRGSFPQFVLQPVNFEALYTQQRQAKAAQAATAESGAAH